MDKRPWRYKNLADRILSNTIKAGECWCWNLSVSPDGYGQMSVRIPGERYPKKVWVHRVAYELFVGPIPPGMTVDHRIEEGICHHKSCWRPDHVRLLSAADNTSIMREYRAGLSRWMRESGVQTRLFR